jgi:glycosyltransferase involved in cell wall biosynthesis
MSICAVVPVWNGRDLLARLLDTLDAQTLRAEEVLVIDNGSTDGAPDLARRRGARVISMGRNAGFAAAVNCGIRHCRADWVAALNSDVELAPDYFQVLAGTNAWFATGKILTGPKPAGTAPAAPGIDGTFDLVCRGGCAWRVGSGRPDGPLRLVPGGRRFRPALRRGGNRRHLRAARRGVASGECRARPLAFRDCAAHRPQPGAVARQALSARRFPAMCMADLRGTPSLGCCGPASWEPSGVDAG